MTNGINEFTGYTTLKSSFTSLKVDNSFVSPENITVSIKLGIDDIDFKLADYYINKVKYWIDESLANSFVFDSTKEEGFKIVLHSSNNLIFTPGPPTDTLLSLLLFRKIKSIVPSGLVFFELEVSNHSIDAASTITSLKLTEELPALAKDYCAIELYPDEPAWWMRSDPYTFELPVVDGLSREEAYTDGTLHNIFDDFEEAYAYENGDTEEDNHDEEQQIIKVKKWTPRLA